MGYLFTLAGLAVVCLFLLRFAVWARRKGVGGGLMGPIDEAWHPSADRFRREIATHEERVLPPRPGDDRDRP
ncbi:hypothetical protein Ait01nite_100340 [Actinoplanes italicus]|uniref:Uncharacterized protein n=1 Tax=Actinoplanes italicus TaxID=113567 RepID=A0A2T0JC81_9ACTN|nr:hypothetical protein [Actinoplanes italicus]PRX05099.1 hypothetical protein CLV67_14612 [Actinoplanes italicus]GIE36989.1 hypothetical protein Ait01nite_100340 [Actinoplanes italicus]